MSDPVVLLPCPFCGSAAIYGEVSEGENFGGQFIECDNPMCGCSTCLMFPSMDSVKEQLREKWNARADELTDLRTQLAAAQRERDDASAEANRWRNVAKSYDDSSSRKFYEEFKALRQRAGELDIENHTLTQRLTECETKLARSIAHRPEELEKTVQSALDAQAAQYREHIKVATDALKGISDTLCWPANESAAIALAKISELTPKV